jgi:hypothetical protein
MFTAHLICSDARCAEDLFASAVTLGELDTLSCGACGCGLTVIGWPDHVEPAVAPADAIVLAFERAELPVRLAA